MTDKPDHSNAFTITSLIQQQLELGKSAVVITLMSGLMKIGSKLLIAESGESFGTLGDAELDSKAASRAIEFSKTHDDARMFSLQELGLDDQSDVETLLLFERIQPLRRLVICGAGHVGASLATLGSFLGYETTLIDDRPEFLDPERFSGLNVRLMLTDNWTNAVSEAVGNGVGIAVAVVTRGHNEDEQCMHAVIKASPDYVGLIGSKRRTSIVIDRLRDAGADENTLRNIRAPIGLDIGAVSPEEVALAIIAEIVAERRGAKGGSLSAWRREEKKS
jgi:xanthine dehydrogenase accessory factor